MVTNFTMRPGEVVGNDKTFYVTRTIIGVYGKFVWEGRRNPPDISRTVSED